MPFTFGEPFEAGQSTSVQCMVVAGDIPLGIQWSKDGKNIHSSGDVIAAMITQKLSLLSIDSVSAEHVGNYTCTADNVAGIANHTARLLVNGLCLSA